jgi:hypothetical protein
MSEWKLDRASAYVPDVAPDSDLAMYRKANFGHLCLPFIRPVGLTPPAVGTHDGAHQRAGPPPPGRGSAAAPPDARVRLY